jgi:hypothetical protein
MTAPSTPAEPVDDATQDADTTKTPGTSLRDRLSRLDNLLALVSAVLLPLGFVLILFGWYGAARTPNLFEQIPYLISGGLIGVAMVIGAGLLYFGSWVASAARTQRAADDEMLATLKEIRDELRRREVPVPAQPTRSRRASANGAPRAPEFVATASGSMLHRPDCTIVADRNDLHAVDPDTSGMRPCRLCHPLATPPQRVRS